MLVGLLGSSRDEMGEDLKASADKVIEILESRSYSLVLGGASGGIMKEAYNRFLKADHDVFVLQSKNRQKEEDRIDLSTLFLQQDNFERSRSIYEKSDVFVFLPGGTGTLAEVFGFLDYESETGKQKPILFYNETGMYTPVLELIQKAIENHLIRPDVKNLYTEVKNTKEFVDALESIDGKRR